METLGDVFNMVAEATKDAWDDETTLGDLGHRYVGGHSLGGSTMTGIARSEFLQRVGVPATYRSKPFFDGLRPDTQRAVVMDSIAAHDLSEKPVLARYVGGTLRAVVSDYYTCVAHTAMISALMGAQTSLALKDYWPKDFTAECGTLHLRLTTPTTHQLNGDDDVGHTMIHVVNSEVGRAALIVDAGIYRLVCENGLIARVGGALILQERHVYREPRELIGKFSAAVTQAEQVAAGFLALLRVAREQQVDDVDRVLLELPSDRMRGLVSEVLEGDTVFDLYNAVTNAAQQYTPASQHNWERWARTLLDRDWSIPHRHPDGETCPECGVLVSTT